MLPQTVPRVPRLRTPALAALLAVGLLGGSAWAQDGDAVADPAESGPAPAAPADPSTAADAGGMQIVAAGEDAAPADPYAEGGTDAQGFASFDERVSYAIGLDIAAGLKQQFASLGLELQPEQVAAALTAGEAAKLTPEQMAGCFKQLQARAEAQQQAMMQEQMIQQQKLAETHAAAGLAFLEVNGQREGVHTTDSGLQYAITQQGVGPMPKPDDTVLVHYTGTLLDGTKFDSSAGGEPVPFPLDRVIPGFAEGLQLFAVGSKGTLWIPGDLGYGLMGEPRAGIEPNQLLTFQVEVVGIQPRPDQVDDAPAQGREPLAD